MQEISRQLKQQDIYKVWHDQEWEVDGDSADTATELSVEHRHFQYGMSWGVKRSFLS